MKKPHCLLFGLALIAAPQQPVEAADGPVFRAGAATSNITPQLGASLNGGMRDRTATDVHDELHARALALDDGRTKLVLVVCDSCLIPREVHDAAKALAGRHTGIPVTNMLISATHTHSAPSAASAFQSEADLDYREFLVVRIADAIRRAVGNLEPAQIGWGRAEEPGHVFNRRWHMKPGLPLTNPFGMEDQVRMNPGVKNAFLDRPAGPVDPEIRFLSVKTRAGRPLALLANYSLHYVGGVNGVSADYFGAFAERLAYLLNVHRQEPPFVGIMSNGTSGDINNINFKDGGPRHEPYEKIKLVAGDVAIRVVRGLDEVQYHDWVPLAAAQAELQLGVRRPSADDLARAKKILAESPNRFPDLKSREEIYARETVQLHAYPEQVELVVQALRIGELGVTAIPCEVFVEIGLELKRRNPFPASFTVSLANGYNAYLPTPEQHALGGYETWRAKSSYLETGASPKIVRALLDLLGRLNP